MKKPVIGITADLSRRQEGVHLGHLRHHLNDSYLKAVLRAGGAPVILPVTTCEEALQQQAEIIDGLLLSGGGDVNPLLFGEEPDVNLGGVDHERDAAETLLIRMAFAKRIPIFAICRGVQILNAAFGGTLYQHIYSQHFGVQHEQKTAGDFASHTIIIKEGSKLASLLGSQTVTNSFHHQAVKKPAADFIVAANAKDGLIEAIEHADLSLFVLGVQWHPELMTEKHPPMLKLFEAFVGAAKRG